VNPLASIPGRLRLALWRLRHRNRNALGWHDLAAIRLLGSPPGPEFRLSYGLRRAPGLRDSVYGGAVKLVYLNRHFPHHRHRFNLLYLVSSALPPHAETLVRLSRRNGAKIVWNQNGVAYPACLGPQWEQINRPMKAIRGMADYVLYQSVFCRASAERFLGACAVEGHVLPNPVDVHHFRPADVPLPPEPLVLLLAGNQNEAYRLRSALETVARIRDAGRDVRLLITGHMTALRAGEDLQAAYRAWLDELSLENQVEWLGAYTQAEAPDIFRRAHLLLHTKFNDPCPTVVLEAMASGLPVIHSASGGVPDLVGDTGGGVPVPVTFDRLVAADPDRLAAEAMRVADSLPAYSAAARERAVRSFSLTDWIEEHRSVFHHLLADGSHT
jgi:glycosyltransferase involved in cell wall biosynthesis